MFDEVWNNYTSCHYRTSCPAYHSKDGWWSIDPNHYTVAHPSWAGTPMKAPHQGNYFNPYTQLEQTMKHYNPKGFRSDDW